jgi:hypothetical protein
MNEQRPARRSSLWSAVQGTASFIKSLAAQFGGLLGKQFLPHKQIVNVAALYQPRLNDKFLQSQWNVSQPTAGRDDT